MNDAWIEGRFEGTYAGRRLPGARGADPARRFSFRVRSGVVRDAKVVEAPPTDAALAPEAGGVDELHGGEAPIRQDRVGRIELSVPALDIDRPETSLFDVQISDWRLSRPAEAKGRSFGRIDGTILARLTPPAPAPLREAAEPGSEPGPETELESGLGSADDAPRAERAPAHPAEASPTRPSERARFIDERVATRSTLVEGPDADTIVEQLSWGAAITLLAGVGAGLYTGCGGPVAATWCAATGAAVGVRLAARRRIRTSSMRQGGLAVVLVAAQAGLWLEPLLAGAQPGCAAPSLLQGTGIGAAVVAAGLLRGRGALLATCAVLLAAMWSWCNATNGTCTPAASATSSAAHQPPPRTSTDGHWPVMPDLRQGGGGGGGVPVGGTPGGTGLGSVSFDGEATDGVGTLRVSGNDAAPMARSGAGDVATRAGGEGAVGEGAAGDSAAGSLDVGPRTAHDANLGLNDVGPPTPGFSDDAAIDSIDARATAPAEPPSSRPRRGGSASTRGGWVAADHRRASAHAQLISIEHANRVPEAFFGSGGQRRVYVPTDAIFEPGAADLRATGALQLGRIAALLDLHPERRTVLVVHTDAGGGLDAQQSLSERRAAAVRTWLLDRGHVGGDRFSVVGAGAAQPLVPPDGSYTAQQPNRRIEISLAE